MPTFKHPCPHCGKWIERDVRACPYCGTSDPFAPGRCPACRAIVEDPAWTACPKCGASLKKEPAAAPESADKPPGVAAPPGAQSPPAAAEQRVDPRRCTGCGAPLPAGARFCTACGTLATA